MPLQNDIQNISSEFNSFVLQSVTCSKRSDMHMAGYVLIRCNFVYDSVLLDLGLLSRSLDTYT